MNALTRSMILTGAGLLPAISLSTAHAQLAEEQPFLQLVRSRAESMRAEDTAPRTLAEWTAQKQLLRQQLAEAWGPFPVEPCPLAPKLLGELERDGYRLEKILIQTMPGIWMTSNAYVPNGKGPYPAVLCVHGHWSGAKQDPVVQARCIGLAKLGFFVLAVDAFGAGERGLGKKLGEYHGEMVAATLIPTGRVLAGVQVYENSRALDYLQSRPEVNPKRLGVTGTSGGGNQSMYIGAWDARLGAVVPTCSVGTYQSYLGAACCMCEVVPGALRFTEEWRLLAMVAPRALLVSSATKDSVQFSVGEAHKSIERARPVFALHQSSNHLRHAIFDAGHGYDQSMREAMYGWMTLHLKGEGDGSPIPEPEVKPEDRESVRCYPGESRPDDWITLPRFAATEAGKLLDRIPQPGARVDWLAQKKEMQGAFTKMFNRAEFGAGPGPEIELDLHDEPGTKDRVALLLDLDGREAARGSEIARALRAAQWRVLSFDLRATGSTSVLRDQIGRAPDHNSAEWSLWTGPTLLQQWVQDVRSVLETSGAKDVTVIGNGAAGLVAITSALTDERIARVVTIGSLASYVSAGPYQDQRLGIMVPGILRQVGDIQHLAALVAPRSLFIAGGVNGGGAVLSQEALNEEYAFTKRGYALEAGHLEIAAAIPIPDLVKRISMLR